MALLTGANDWENRRPKPDRNTLPIFTRYPTSMDEKFNPAYTKKML